MCAAVQPNSANTPVNYHRRGRGATLLLAIFLMARMYLKYLASHLLLTESGILRMGPIGYSTGDAHRDALCWNSLLVFIIIHHY